ncbi:DUF6090 family protein [[Muricauda] lutisoli]|uniref:Uncharacterized protein n=1 Tax=[Muricauda] lutisoli TaxID=2816035 RepID=A0ABS3EXZ2_9FLAO|nr:DUF6090 family protein [[Muricauda] lutisoli]MBO0331110.1 hypothetical protein [[Muricauda] lutisoli]
MPTIFRKIRKALLSENKFSKYLLYALGEIILVVIGILLALQINTCNNEKIQDGKEQFYLSEIRSSLVQDSLTIKKVLEFNIKKKKVVSDMMGTFSDTLNNQQRIAVFNQSSDVFVDYRLFEPSTTTFNNMLSAETISVIKDNQLKNMLTNYYEYNYSEGVQERLVQMNRKVVDEAFPEFFTREFAKAQLNLDTELRPIDQVEFHKSSVLISDLYGIGYLLVMQDNFLKTTLSDIDKLIKKIDQNLE